MDEAKTPRVPSPLDATLTEEMRKASAAAAWGTEAGAAEAVTESNGASEGKPAAPAPVAEGAAPPAAPGKLPDLSSLAE